MGTAVPTTPVSCGFATHHGLGAVTRFRVDIQLI